jgi:hypothetical protein
LAAGGIVVVFFLVWGIETLVNSSQHTTATAAPVEMRGSYVGTCQRDVPDGPDDVLHARVPGFAIDSDKNLFVLLTDGHARAQEQEVILYFSNYDGAGMYVSPAESTPHAKADRKVWRAVQVFEIDSRAGTRQVWLSLRHANVEVARSEKGGSIDATLGLIQPETVPGRGSITDELHLAGAWNCAS